MGRRFVTAEDIDTLVRAGRSRLEVDARTTLTDLARERAHDRGVAIVEVDDVAAERGSGPRAGRTGAGEPPGAGAGPARSSEHRTSAGGGDVPRRRFRAAVRAAVVAELGRTPDGLDAAIGRVLDRFGITD